ncbi:hypothetical protein [Actinacidiphila alni]|uniref:X-X-X-Leu-X-X-Gly heptad repeat-containing protein n=1 Tax=Actinacidiphila alni TaxID=380248 RepID=A0A1I2E968_9ACTN|nr:hypothetical protein [Actinacidiphila alni]SFE89179.1 X-X-X-Leu-X-X-Gly heptad repeat-containing protein [Actinacidiphila alni]
MTYGTLDGTLPPDPPKPKHKLEEYDGGTTLPDGSGVYSDGTPFDPPSVPGGSGGGKGTSVDTPSMTLFADNIGKLVPPTQAASKKLEPISVAPGAFYHADQIRTKVSGLNGDAGLKSQYVKVLADLAQGLGDLRDGVTQLAAKYTSLEDANSMTATDLQTAMQSATGDFTALLTDSGGAAA